MTNAGLIMAPFAFEDVYGEEGVSAIAKEANLLGPVVTREDVLEGRVPWLADVDLLFTSWGAPKLDQSLLAQMPRLRAVFFGAGSVRDMVTEKFWERGIALSVAATINAQPVAEYTLGAILLSLKRALSQARAVREARSYPASPANVPGGYQSVIGLVSFGQIGRRLRELLRPFDLRVLVYDPTLTAADVSAVGAVSSSLEEIFAEADVVSLHTPWLPSTEGLITGELVARMKPGATLINTARGAIVRESELIDVLIHRPDLQAILDVTWPEPPPHDSLLYQLPNVMLTPHIAGSIGRERRRIGAAMIAEMKRYLRGAPLLHELERENIELQA